MRLSDPREYTPGTLTDLHSAWLPHPEVDLQNDNIFKKMHLSSVSITLYELVAFWHLGDSRHGNLPCMTVDSGGDLGAGR